jgi:hypothetical protein
MSICICNPHAEPESETMPNCPIHGVKAMARQSKHAPERPEWLNGWLAEMKQGCILQPTQHCELRIYIRALEASAKETTAELARLRETNRELVEALDWSKKALNALARSQT